MKKTDALMKVVAVLLFCAMASYLGLNVYRRATDPVQTALAVSATVTDAVSMSGLAVRCEQVVVSSEPYIEVTASEGEKLAAGEAVATIYASEGALKRALELRALEQQVSQASAALEARQAGGTVNRDETVYAALTALSADVRRGDLADADERGAVLEGLLFQQDDAVTQEDLDALRAQVQALSEEAAGETLALTAPVGGTFSAAVDGFEDLTPEAAAALSPDELRLLASSSRSAPNGAVGKLVTSYRWDYAAVLSAADAARLAAGDSVQLSFGRYYSGALPARVESVGPAANGECTVLFSMDRGLTELMAVRSVSAELVFEEQTGLRVPAGGLWRYWAGLLSETDAAGLSPGEQVTLSLGGGSFSAFVSDLGSPDEDGRCQVVLCWPWDASPAPDSSLAGTIGTAEGAVLSADAYYGDSTERLCVFTMTGLQAERKKVTLVYAGEDFCLVASEGDDALREGNDIIVSSAELYNGRVFD